MSESKTCRCGGELRIELVQSGVHYGKRICTKCGAFNGWEPKPDSDPTKYRRPQSHRDLVEKFSRGFCEMCLTPQADLPKGQTLEANHVEEFADGGSPKRENIWIVCTGCHRLIHWIRTYSGKGRGNANAAVNVAEAMTQWKR